MHSDHEMFIRGIERQRRLKVTYIGDRRREKLIRRCGPLYYSRGKTEADGLECYYLWDFEADEGHNFLALPPGRIVGMELAEDAFSIEEVSDLVRRPGRSTEDFDTVCDR
ncbi:MAG: hypothetical protein AMJ65_05975 [Phycisphaerae bacterium SG8_4]|nr:MAG: hypothetical protein AMJ65_05975 [Phycisphaerae bacterium SG8_4]